MLNDDVVARYAHNRERASCDLKRAAAEWYAVQTQARLTNVQIELDVDDATLLGAIVLPLDTDIPMAHWRERIGVARPARLSPAWPDGPLTSLAYLLDTGAATLRRGNSHQQITITMRDDRSCWFSAITDSRWPLYADWRRTHLASYSDIQAHRWGQVT